MKERIALSLVPLIAAVLAGCDDQQVSRTCLDPQQQVVEVQKCEDMYAHGGQVPGQTNWFYYWYYVNGNYRPALGSRAVIVPGKGSYTAPEGFAFGRGESIGVSRGGFGSSAHGSGAGE